MMLSLARFRYVFILMLLTMLIAGCSNQEMHDQRINRYFNSIRHSEAELTAFFQGLPKGGDLHNHYSGSIYAETYWQYLEQQDVWLDTVSLQYEYDSIKQQDIRRDYSRYRRLSDLRRRKRLSELRQKMFTEWSIKDYHPAYRPSDQHFFDSFRKFPATGSWHEIRQGLGELKARAASENIQYLELMLRNVPFSETLNNADSLAVQLYLHDYRDTIRLRRVADAVYQAYESLPLNAAVDRFCQELDSIHTRYVGDSTVTIRYQTYVNRGNAPLIFFRDLLLAFRAADRSPWVVGVNILSPEHSDISMRDYKLHMYLFRYVHRLYPQVQYAMHAGELTLGLVKPEDLTTHIHDAVFVAGAHRIGHGVDLAHEAQLSSLLDTMARRPVPIEINLWSNEFILKVKDGQHPITLYHQHGVPIVIATDDPGVLRSNLTHQFVLLAKRYPQINYADIRRYIRNSIQYSFLEEARKKSLLQALEQSLHAYESTYIYPSPHTRR